VPYFTNFGPRSGPILWRHGLAAIRVLAAHGEETPIGEAISAGSDEHGLTLWNLTIREAEVPGLWVVVDREFRPAAGIVAGLVAAIETEDRPMGSSPGRRPSAGRVGPAVDESTLAQAGSSTRCAAGCAPASCDRRGA
jgi:hypothetical protein